MKVWVIMGNDYPDAVALSEERADAYIKRKQEEELIRQRLSGSRQKIYWRLYEFETVR